jgi:hypothetical protein
LKAIDRLPVEDLRRLFRYEPETGRIFWNIRTRMDFSVPPSDAVLAKWNQSNAGKEAFTRTSALGYLWESALGERLLAHRVAFAVTYGRHPKDQIDHLNGIRHDNRLENLREATNQQNARNQRRRKTNLSGATGVFWHSHAGKWCAQIRTGGHLHSLGLFEDFDLAVAARKKAEKRLGFHENHGSDSFDPEESPEQKM